MMYVKAGLALLQASGLVTRLVIGAGLAAALVAAYGLWHHRVYTEGYNGALAAIARQDERAIARATELRSTFKTCRDLGRRWDQTTGACS